MSVVQAHLLLINHITVTKIYIRVITSFSNRNM